MNQRSRWGYACSARVCCKRALLAAAGGWDDCVALTGLSRTRIYLWHKDVIGVPDREILGGFWLKYVDVKTDAGA